MKKGCHQIILFLILLQFFFFFFFRLLCFTFLARARLLSEILSLGLEGDVAAATTVLLGSRDHSVLDLTCHGDESLLDVRCVLCRSLEEGDAQRVRKLLSAGRLDSAFGGEVALVADKQSVDVLAGVALDLREPLLDVGEGGHVCDVIHNNDAVCPAVVAAGDGAETLLTGCVPLYI